MKDLNDLFEMIKERILLLEQNIVQSIANHNVLLGQHGELKSLLDNYTKEAEEVATASSPAKSPEVLDAVVVK